MISATTARTMVRKGCKSYLEYVIDTKKEEPSLLDIPIVFDYPVVFSEEFPKLPPQREIEFAIDVVQGTTSASITPYQMARVYHHGELQCSLLKRKMVCFGCVLIIGN